MKKMYWDYILIEKNEQENKTASGIVLASKEKNDTLIKGKVLSYGIGRLLQNGEFDKPKVEIGDTVFFPKIEALVLEDEGQYYYVIRETAIMGKL
jgi:co-chaperonin GroES (HSP10)